MKHSLNSILNSTTINILAQVKGEQPVSFIQDMVHILTKLRNRLLKPSVFLPLGSKQVAISHVKILIDTVPKETHGLIYSDICPDDRQNFDSFRKVSEPRVLNALSGIIDSEATVMFLKVCRAISSAYLDVNMPPFPLNQAS